MAADYRDVLGAGLEVVVMMMLSMMMAFLLLRMPAPVPLHVPLLESVSTRMVKRPLVVVHVAVAGVVFVLLLLA